MAANEHTFRAEAKETLKLAGPVVVAQLAQISLGFVDTVMVGRLGSEALAGVALGNTIFFFLFVVCMGVVLAVGPLVSQAYGAGEEEPIGRSVRQGLWLGLVLTVPAFALLWNIAPVLRALGQVEAVIVLVEGYLRAIAWGLLPALWFVALRAFIEGVSRPWPVTLIALAGVGVNVVANYVLMFGKMGFPALGLVGTGWASTIVFWVMFWALALYIRRKPSYRRYGIFTRLGKPDGQYFRELFRIGWPIGVTYGLESGLFTFTAFLMGLFGTTALAAHQVALQSAAFTFMVPLGIGIAASVRVGQAVGRGDAEGVRWAGYAGIGMAALFMTGTAVLFWTAPEAVISLYLEVDSAENRAVVDLAVILLGVAAVFQVFDGVQVSAAGALRGMKDTRIPMLIGFFSYWLLGLSAGYILGFRLHWGAVGLWWGLVLGLGAAAVLLLLRFRRGAARFRPAAAGEAQVLPSA